MTTQLRYVFDLDGTLCTQRQDGRYELAEPMRDRIAAVNRLYDEGHLIIIDTARGNGTGYEWQQRTARQLQRWGLKYHHLYTQRKPWAHFYIDDRGMSDRRFFDDRI